PALRAAGAEPDERVLWPLAFAGFFLAFLGASTLIPHHDPGTTRFGLAYEVGGILAVIGATLSAIALVDRRLGRGAFVCALALLPVPALAGHALDPGQWPRPLNVAADILHVGAASVWIGGLLALAIALPRASRRRAACVGRGAVCGRGWWSRSRPGPFCGGAGCSPGQGRTPRRPRRFPPLRPARPGWQGSGAIEPSAWRFSRAAGSRRPCS